MSISRRKFIKGAILLPGISMGSSLLFASPWDYFNESNPYERVRPNDAQWPSHEKWEQLNKAVNGNLIKVESPLAVCETSADNSACEELFRNLKNPYYIGDSPALTQTSGWVDA
ncbi:MAG: hypothetical protein ABIO60_09525, partial [Aquaticitalea sp.]